MKSNPSTADITNLPKGYRAYQIKGVAHTIIARNGGPSFEDIKTKPSYESLRQNQKEFAAASMIAKTMRNSLCNGLSEICHPYISGQLTAKFRNLAKYEEGVIGKRPIKFSKHGHILTGFDFNPESPCEKIFGAKYHIKSGSTKGQVIIHFPAFTPDQTFQRPDEVTNFKIKARLVALSDVYFDENTQTYRAKNEEIHGQYAKFESTMLPMLKIPIEPMTFPLTIPGTVNQTDHTGFFLVMAVSFYQLKQGKFHHLGRQSGMHISKVY